MFTIKFFKHDGGTKSYSATAYEVSPQDEQAPPTVQVKMELTDSRTEYFEQIGDFEPYSHAYVTNSEGRTIDKIVVKG